MHPFFNPVAPYRYLLPNVYLLGHISQLQTCLRVVVGPGFVSTLSTFMRSSASHLAWPACQKGVDTICTAVFQNSCDSSTACRLCCLEPSITDTSSTYQTQYSQVTRECTLNTDDHSGQLISDLTSNLVHIILNNDTPTRMPHTTLHQTTLVAITALYNHTTWHTTHATH